MADWKKYFVVCLLVFAADGKAASGLDFDKDVKPVLERYCYDCHGEGAKKGGLALDQHKNAAERLGDHEN